jgi:hypothetical protein
MAVALSTFRVYHSGTNGTTITIVFEASYYNGAGVAQPYVELTGQESTYSMKKNMSITEYTK